MSANDPGHPPASGERADEAPAHRSSDDDSGLASTGRRRALLKGLGKAGAVAGAAIPLRSLATGEKNLRLPKNGKNYRCTVSAQASLLHSAAAALPPACTGRSRAHYCTPSNWPQVSGKPVCWVGGVSHASTVSLDTAMGFSGGTPRSNRSLTHLVNNEQSTDAAHWVVALLNAHRQSATFPYSTSEVQALYADPGKRTAAIAFFRTYLEGQ